MKAKLRRPAIVSNSFSSCIEALNNYNFEDGEIIIGRYREGSATKQLIAIGGISGEFELFFPYSSRNNTMEDILSFISSSDGSHSAADTISFIKQGVRKTSTGEYVISELGSPDNNLLTLSDVITAMFSSVKTFNNEFKKSGSVYIGKNLLRNSSKFQSGNATSGLIAENTFFSNFVKIDAPVSNSGVWSEFISRDDLQGIEDQFEEGEDFSVSFLMSYYDPEKFGLNPTEPAIENQGKPTFLLKGISGYNGLDGELSTDISILSYSGKWRKSGDITPQFNFANSQGSFIIYAWKIEKSATPTEFYIPQSELVSILATTKHKLESLTSKIDSLDKTTISNSDGSLTTYPNLFDVVEKFNRMTSHEYNEDDKPANVNEFLSRYPKGMGKAFLNQMLTEFLNYSELNLREDDTNILDLLNYSFYGFGENLDGSFLQEFYTEEDMGVGSFFKNIKQIYTKKEEDYEFGSNIAFNFIEALTSWANPDISINLNGPLFETYNTDDENGRRNPFLDGKTEVSDRSFGEHWQHVKNALLVFKTIILFYYKEDPLNGMFIRYRKTFSYY